MTGEDFVGTAPEQERVRAVEHAADECAKRSIEVRQEPAAVAKAAAPILGRSAGSLHDAVQGQKGGGGEHGFSPLERTNELRRGSTRPQTFLLIDASWGSGHPKVGRSFDWARHWGNGP